MSGRRARPFELPPADADEVQALVQRVHGMGLLPGLACLVSAAAWIVRHNTSPKARPILVRAIQQAFDHGRALHGHPEGQA